MSASGSPPRTQPRDDHAFQTWDWTFDALAADTPDAPPPPTATAATTSTTTSASFFDNLLNPALADDPAFAYTTAAPYTMPASRPHPPRHANAYLDLTAPQVDLTSAHVDLTDPDSPPRRRKRDSPTPGPSAKRLKPAHAANTTPDASTSNPPDAPIEHIDLSQDDDILDVLNKQREEAIRAQAKPVETITTFNSFNCVICMDRPTDITATACGHLFCHTCLMEALIAGENRTGPGQVRRSQCPVCRKTISRNKPTDVIPLLLKKGLAKQPRRKPDPVPVAS